MRCAGGIQELRQQLVKAATAQAKGISAAWVQRIAKTDAWERFIDAALSNFLAKDLFSAMREFYK